MKAISHMGTLFRWALLFTLLLGVLGSLDAQTLAVEVPVDVKPRSCPNFLDARSRGVLSVAILGTRDFDVTQINPASIRLAGVTPLGAAFEDVATPIGPWLGKEQPEHCTDQGPDGFLDLTLAFDIQEVIEAIEAVFAPVEGSAVVVLPLEGTLFEGTSITGEDVAAISKNGSGDMAGLSLTTTLAASTLPLLPDIRFPDIRLPDIKFPELCPPGEVAAGSICIPKDLPRSGGGGGGCTINPGSRFDPTLASGVGLMLMYLGWKHIRRCRRCRSVKPRLARGMS